MPTSPQVSVILPVHNGGAGLRRTLDALLAQSGPAFEVIVVDNASTDDSARLAHEHPIGAHVVAEPRRGSYAARNAGLTVARAPVLAFTDADCTPEPRWLAAGVAALDGTNADLAGGAVRALRSSNASLWERYDRATYLRQEDLVVNHGWGVTANLFVRRTVVDRVGPFDATLPSSGDREFCLRARQAGFRIVYAGDAVVGHQPRTTWREIWTVNRRVGAGLGLLAERGEVGPWWRSREHWMKLDWVVHLASKDGPPLRRRHLLPVHALAMSARLYGRLRKR